ncbi:hypothetical protein NCS52_00812500 [Fusarium sp. LHS14.1]|nr:hypothetical protein NCS52_00812500 [Fusarium sp. LHS14.1]
MDPKKNALSTEVPGSSSPETPTSHDSAPNMNTSLTPAKTPESTTKPCNNDKAKDTDMATWPWVRKHTTPCRPKRVTGLASQSRLLRNQHTRREFIRQQMIEGRPDPYRPWCGDPSCKKDGRVFMLPYSYPVNAEKCRKGLPVEDYFHDLAEAMTIMLFPGLKNTEDKTRKCFEVLSFIDSPPIRSHASKMVGGLVWLGLNPTDRQFEVALIRARPVFLDLMFGVKTAERVETIHSYVTAKAVQYREWNLHDFIIRFLVSAELWRVHETPRKESWVIGSREAVGEFLSAVLLSYRELFARSCLGLADVWQEKWDQIWQEWLEKYPVSKVLKDDDEDFKLRERQDLTEDDVLEQVGYLGGIGKADGTYKPRRNRPEEPDQTLYFF